MVWTPPRTWYAGEYVTATIMNQHVRDNLNALAKSRVLAIGFGDPTAGVLATGVKGYVEVPFACKIVGWTLLADQVGSLVIDVWRDSYANFPPTVGDTIAGTEKPTISAAQKGQDLTLTTWSPDVSAGDVLGFKIDSVSAIKQATLTLRLELAA